MRAAVVPDHSGFSRRPRGQALKKCVRVIALHRAAHLVKTKSPRFDGGEIKIVTSTLRRSNAAVIVCISLCGFSASAADKGTYQTFAISGASITAPYAINAEGDVTGTYLINQTTQQWGCFVRYNKTGQIYPFSVDGTTFCQGNSINEKGEVIGYAGNYPMMPCEQTGIEGFVLTSAETQPTTFTVSGSSSTYPRTINKKGDIVGYYCDGTVPYGFIRDNGNGHIKSIKIKMDTTAYSLNDMGEITGWFDDFDGEHYGFILSQNTTPGKNCGKDCQAFSFDNSKGKISGQAVSINNSEVVTGGYYDSDGASHGYVYDKNADTFTKFDHPHAGNQRGQGTFPYSINDARTIAGWWVDGAGDYHSFVRKVKGRFLDIAPTGAVSAQALGINSTGQVTGLYDLSGSDVVQGFIYTPGK